MMKYTVNKCYRFDQKTDDILKKMLSNANSNKKRKMSETELVREIIRRAYQEESGIPKDAFIKMGRDLSGMGNNLNQLAHKINADMFSYKDLLDLRKCMEEVNYLRMTVKELTASMY